MLLVELKLGCAAAAIAAAVVTGTEVLVAVLLGSATVAIAAAVVTSMEVLVELDFVVDVVWPEEATTAAAAAVVIAARPKDVVGAEDVAEFGPELPVALPPALEVLELLVPGRTLFKQLPLKVIW